MICKAVSVRSVWFCHISWYEMNKPVMEQWSYVKMGLSWTLRSICACSTHSKQYTTGREDKLQNTRPACLCYCLLTFVFSFRVFNTFSSYGKYQMLSCSVDATHMFLSCCKMSTKISQTLRKTCFLMSNCLSFKVQTPCALRVHSPLWQGKKYLRRYSLPCSWSILGQWTGFTLFAVAQSYHILFKDQSWKAL